MSIEAEFPLSPRLLQILRLLGDADPRPRWNRQAAWAERNGTSLKDLAALKKAGLLKKHAWNHGCTTSLALTQAGWDALDQAPGQRGEG